VVVSSPYDHHHCPSLREYSFYQIPGKQRPELLDQPYAFRQRFLQSEKKVINIKGIKKV